MPPIQGVLFDAMNTLIYPHPPVFAVYREAALRQGVDLSIELIGDRFRPAFRGEEERDRLHDLSTSEGREIRRWRDLVAAALPELPDPERGYRELWDHFSQPEYWRCYEDVEPTLRELDARGVPWGIASNFDSRLRMIVASLAEFASREATLAISSEIGWKKPHAMFFQEAARRLGVEPNRILFAGDDWVNDVVGAREAGMQVCFLDRRRNADFEIRSDGQNVPTVRDLREILPFADASRP